MASLKTTNPTPDRVPSNLGVGRTVAGEVGSQENIDAPKQTEVLTDGIETPPTLPPVGVCDPSSGRYGNCCSLLESEAADDERLGLF